MHLSVALGEVNTYGAGHINRYTSDSVGTAFNNNGYGGMAYYSSPTCGYNGTDWVDDECKTDYAQSEVKYVVDAWKAAKAPAASEARLIKYSEVKELGYELGNSATSEIYIPSEQTPSWVYNSNYWYWTMSQYEDSASGVWYVSGYGGLSGSSVVSDLDSYVVRPVITISKSSI